VGSRNYVNFTNYNTLKFEIKGSVSDSSGIQVGMKDRSDPDDGKETKINITGISNYFTVKSYSISSFTTLSNQYVYIPFEIVLSNNVTCDIYLRNIKVTNQ